MNVFFRKQVAFSCVSRDTSIFAVFFDSFKAFDKVDPNLLFKKLIFQNVPLWFISLLRYWYKTQMMKVSWNNSFLDSFFVSNGVCQEGIFSPCRKLPTHVFYFISLEFLIIICASTRC